MTNSENDRSTQFADIGAEFENSAPSAKTSAEQAEALLAARATDTACASSADQRESVGFAERRILEARRDARELFIRLRAGLGDLRYSHAVENAVRLEDKERVRKLYLSLHMPKAEIHAPQFYWIYRFPHNAFCAYGPGDRQITITKDHEYGYSKALLRRYALPFERRKVLEIEEELALRRRFYRSLVALRQAALLRDAATRGPAD